MLVNRAIYTTSVDLGILLNAVTVTQYYHRYLNVKKLFEVGFFQLEKKMTLANTIKYMKIRSVLQMRPLREEDCAVACDKLNQYLIGYKVHPNFNQTEFSRTFIPVLGVISTLVTDDLSEMVSFVIIETTITGMKYKSVIAAYLYYYYCKNKPHDLVLAALEEAHKLNCDVFNCLNIMQNAEFLNSLKFVPGSGKLRYHLTPEFTNDIQSGDIQPCDIQPADIGYVLV